MLIDPRRIQILGDPPRAIAPAQQAARTHPGKPASST
jgi:hypothetical protein